MVHEKQLERGDVVCLDFCPQAGTEMMGWHPALIISPKSYNKRTSLIICCPITSTIRNNPWEVRVPGGLPIQGAILTNQIKSLDRVARKAKFSCSLPPDTLEEVLYKIKLLVA